MNIGEQPRTTSLLNTASQASLYCEAPYPSLPIVTVHMLQYPQHNNTETGQPLPCIPSMNLHISLHCPAGLFASTTRRACFHRPLCRGVSPIMTMNTWLC